MKEVEIQKQILDVLRANNIDAWRVALGSVKHSGIGRKRNSLKGFPDIFGFIPNSKGRIFGIEVKKDKKQKLKDDQIKWQEIFGRHDAIHIVATSVDDVIKEFAEHGVNLNSRA